jgi:hypothetical protein
MPDYPSNISRAQFALSIQDRVVMIFMTYSMPSFTRLLQGVNGVNYRTISRNGTLSTAITICGEINQTRQLIRY